MPTTIDIFASIPHRPPMLLVDEVVTHDEQHVQARKTFKGDEFFFQGHYPGTPILPGVILCEAGMQAGAILLSQLIETAPGQGVPVATRLNSVKFKHVVRPGDTIDIQVELTERMADAYFMKARIRCQEKIAATFDFACTVAKLPSTANQAEQTP